MNPRFRFRAFGVALLVAFTLVFAVHRAQTEEEEAPDANTVVPEALGALSGAFLYQTNMIIGLIGDAKAKGSYDEPTANAVLDGAIGMCAVVDKQWEALHNNGGLSEEDKASIAEMGAAGDLVKKQGEELKAFWQTKDEKHGKAYQEAREQAIARINKILGIK